MLQLVGTEEVMGTACSPFLEGKGASPHQDEKGTGLFLYIDFFLYFSLQTIQTIIGSYITHQK